MVLSDPLNARMSDNELDPQQAREQWRGEVGDMMDFGGLSDDEGGDDGDESSGSDSEAPVVHMMPPAAARRMRGGNPGGNARQIVHMHPLMRLLAGRLAMAERQVATSNDDLVNQMANATLLYTPKAIAAMKACPRDAFVPAAQQGEDCFVDAPLGLDSLGFNVSAPHMHATCLEALNLQPGHRFLDVGSGTGILTACGAYMVGKAGASVGIDVRKAAVQFSKGNVKALEQRSPGYAAAACACHFECHNVFIPSHRHLGKYDRVHVGASCAPDRLTALTALLRPSGGLIVTPVTPSDLRVLVVSPSGHLTSRTLSQVRYSELEVPGDIEVALATMKKERRERLAVPVPPSTFASDVAAIHGSSDSSGSSGSDQSGFSLGGMGDPPEASPRTTWPKRVSKMLRACSSSLGTLESPRGSVTEGAAMDAEGEAVRLNLGELGSADCVLQGTGWSIPVHRAVLKARCEHFRARCESGMRDADSDLVHVPEHFTKEAVAAFVKYLYDDGMEVRMDVQSAVALLHTAHFFGAPRLAGLCDIRLSRELKHASPDDEGACEAAAALLALADEAGLGHLRAVTLDFIVHNYEAVAATPTFAALTKRQSDLISAEACLLLKRGNAVLVSMAEGQCEGI